MITPRRLLATLLLAGCSLACSALRHAGLQQTASASWFTVHARERATAERVLSECEALTPMVLAGPTAGAPFRVEIYCVPSDATYGEGRNLTEGEPELRHVSCIEIDIGRELVWERFIIAHELTHLWLAPEWNPLPQILEEGLADLAGMQADPEAAVCRRLVHGLRLLTWAGYEYPFRFERDGKQVSGSLGLGDPGPGLPGLAGMLELDGTSYHEVGGGQNESLLYSVGFALVNELGAPRLKELCARAAGEGRAQIPPDWILDAAGIARDANKSWGMIGLQLLGGPEQALLPHALLGEGPYHFTKD